MNQGSSIQTIKRKAGEYTTGNGAGWQAIFKQNHSAMNKDILLSQWAPRHSRLPGSRLHPIDTRQLQEWFAVL